MLRARYICHNADQVLKAIKKLKNNKRSKLLRIKPRFGCRNHHLNDVTINFDY